MALTDEELLKLAREALEESEDLHDVWYYQQQHSIVDGITPVYSNHLYFHYKKWSLDPVSLGVFLDFLKLTNKNNKNIFLDKAKCIINLEKLIGEYVKTQRRYQKEIQKEKRSGKISGSES